MHPSGGMGCKEPVKIRENGKDIKKLLFPGHSMMPIEKVNANGSLIYTHCLVTSINQFTEGNSSFPD